MSKLDVAFGAVDNGLDSTLKKLGQSLENVDVNTKKAADSVNSSFSTMLKAGAALALGFGAIKLAASAVTGTLGTFKDSLDLGGKMSDMSAKTGIAVEDLMILGRAFENAGLSGDQVKSSVNKLQKAVIEAGEGLTEPIKAFKYLGVELDDIKTKTPTDQLQMVGEKIMGLATPAERSAVAMKLFGKSGGDMLSVFADGAGGIERAKLELGSFAGIVGKNATQMDSISDQFSAIKNKALEFATGMISKVLPAIELVTTALSRIDAAAMGARLAEVFTGGSNAMKGFADGLAAMKLGEFGAAWDIVWNSIKLQASDSINSIYANIKGLFAAIPVFLNESGIVMIFDNLVSGISNKLSSSLRSVIAEFLQSIGRLGAAADMRLLSDADADRAKLYFNLVNAGVSSIGHNVSLAGDAAKKAYDEAKNSAGKLVETTKLENDLQASKIGLLKRQSEEAVKALANIETAGILDVKIGGQRVSNAERIKELESEIKDAKAQGNEQLAKELEAQKAYYEQLERSLEKNLSLQESQANAAKAYKSSVDNAVKSEEKKTSVLKEQLSLVEKITKEINAAQQAQGIDKGGRIQAQIKEEIEGGNFKRARRLNEKLEDAVKNQEIRGDGKGRDRRNIMDIARAEGIDTFRMSRDQIRDAILKKRQEGLKPANKPLNKQELAAKAAADKPAKADPVDTLTKLVEKIHGLVAKIEPKLPTHALN